MSKAPHGSNRDPHNLKRRLENVADIVFTRIEDEPDMFDVKQLLSAVQIIGMWLTREVKLGDEESSSAGSAVRKFSGAFKTNVARRGKASVGPSSFTFGDSDEG